MVKLPGLTGFSLFAALSFAAPATLHPQPSLLGSELSISEPGLSYQSVSRIVPTDDGGFLVAWWQLAGGVYVRSFDAAGTPRAAAVRLDEGSAIDFLGSDLAADGGGGYLAVWVERGIRDGLQACRVFSRPLDAEGVPAGAALEITLPAPFAISPRIAASQGGFLTTWLRGGAGGGDELVVRRLTAVGAPSGDELVAVSQPGDLGSLEAPSLAVDDQGNAFLLWNQYGVIEWWALFGRALSSDGQLGAVIRISGARSPYCSSPVLADPEGGFVVAWEDAIVLDYSRTQELWLRKFSIDGLPSTDARLVSRLDGTGNTTDRCPTLAIAGDGGLFLGWSRELAVAGSYETLAFAALLDADGAPRGGSFRLGHEAAHRQYAAAVAELAGQRLLAVWGDGLADGIQEVRLLGQRFVIPPTAVDPCRFDATGFVCDVAHDGGGEPLRVAFGAAGDLPLLAPVGGQGRDELCVYRAGTFLCDLARDGGAAELALRFAGRPVDRPFFADLNGDGAAEPCVGRRGIFLCDTARNGGQAEVVVRFGRRDDWPLMGDVDGDGDDEPCLWRGGRFLCDTAHDGRTAETRVYFGLPGDIPLLADADRDGDDDFCVYRGDRFLCDLVHDGGGAELEVPFGAAGAVPLLGNVDGI